MNAATANAAARWLTQVPLLQVVESITLVTDALALSLRLKHPAYDCFYLALARQAGCPLVTADKRLVERCQRADAVDLGGIWCCWLRRARHHRPLADMCRLGGNHLVDPKNRQRSQN
jgi:hypothetical protein